MKTVWIVTSGSYSDYRIEKVFSTEELAEAWCADMRDGYQIEEWDIDDIKPEPKNQAQSHDCKYLSLDSSISGMPSMLEVEDSSIYITRKCGYGFRLSPVYEMKIHFPKDYSSEKCARAAREIYMQIKALHPLEKANRSYTQFDRFTFQPKD